MCRRLRVVDCCDLPNDEVGGTDDTSLAVPRPSALPSQVVTHAAAEVEPVSVRISSTGNRVGVIAEKRDDVSVDGEARVTREGNRTTIDSVRSRIVVRVPEGADLVLGTTSARVEVEGRAGSVALVTESGRIAVEEAVSVDARTTNAEVTVGRVVHDCRIRTVSGRVEVGGCGDADVATKTGRIMLNGVDGAVRAHCVSGRIEIELESAHDVEAETVSGRITVSLPHGVDVREVTGPSLDGSKPSGCDCTVNVRSVSGRVDISRR